MNIGKPTLNTSNQQMVNCARVANNLRNIDFNPTQFNSTLTGSGLSISIRPQPIIGVASYKKPFDLAKSGAVGSSSESETDASSWYIKSNKGRDMCRILGLNYALIDGDNTVYDADSDTWSCNTTLDYDGNGYTYLAFNRKDLEIKIHTNDFFPEFRSDAGDNKHYISYQLLWWYYDPAYTGTIDLKNMIDCRNDYALSGMI